MLKSRTKKTLLNARVSIIYYLFSIGVAFYSRKIFLEYLGADFMGLTASLGNILGYLNLAELGIGTAMAFNLYKPLNDNDRTKLNELMSLFRYLYRKIGLFIAIGALAISLFFPFIFKNTGFEFALIYYAFFSLLFSSLIGYFINYRTILLSADQKEYQITKYTETTRIITILIQMFLLYKTRNLYLYLSINILLSIVNSYLINRKLDEEFPWLKPDASRGYELRKKHPNILHSVRQVFTHKFKDVALNQSDQIFIFSFETLEMVTYYGNYTLVATRAMQLFVTTFNSLFSSVGNLVAEGDLFKIRKVFWELMAMRYFVAGILVFCMYHLLSPLIILWIGEEYLLSQTVLILILINVFISQTRGVVDMFNNAYGHYKDIWAAWAELIINISITLIGGYFYGLEGILIGKLTGLILIIVIWKPTYLFREGLQIPVLNYWTGAFGYYISFVISTYVIGNLLKPSITINPGLNFYNWILYSLLICISFSFLYGVLMLFFTKGTKDVLFRIPFIKKYFIL